MAGTFSKITRPKLPGTYFNFEVEQPPVPPPVIGRQVAIGFTHSWGPVETPTVLGSLAEFLDIFGGDPNSPSPGYIAVKQAFQGEGLADWGGAGTVLAYRIVGSAGAKATRALTNTTPATALTLTAKYEGADGNNLKITTQDHASNPAQNELLLLYGTTVVETYVYNDTDINGLRDQINANSKWVTAVANVNGVALSTVTSSSFASGNDGSTLIASDYTKLMSDLEIFRFGFLTFANLTDLSILASVKTWAQGQQAAGRRFFTVVGGAAGEVMSDAVARSASLNDPDFVNVGCGTVKDNNLLDVTDTPIVLSTAQLAPRIAGILAYRGEDYSTTYARLAGVEIVAGATAADLSTALDGGVVALARFSDAAASVRLEKGLTTFTTTTDAARPRTIFSQPKYVQTMHGLQQDLQLWGDDNIVGKAVVNDTTRAAVIAEANALLLDRQKRGAVQPGWSAMVDQQPPPSDDDEFIAVVIAAKFGRSVEQVYFTARLG